LYLTRHHGSPFNQDLEQPPAFLGRRPDQQGVAAAAAAGSRCQEVCAMLPAESDNGTSKP